MCNIAGYVGGENATPILLKMIKAQEGLNGGFYSGLAVHDGKRLDYRKARGDLDTLLSETDAETLSGNMGIIHSRTPSGGSGLWAHPFFTERGGELQLCYVANGSAGRYKSRREAYSILADSLVEQGFAMPCREMFEGDKYLRLSDGFGVHMSDVMCQLIYKYKVDGLSTDTAMAEAFTQLPSEIVGLCIERETPDAIYFSRINMPMFVGFDGNGAYLASSPTAFPDSVTDFHLLPALSSGIVYKDRYQVTKYSHFEDKVRGFNRRTVENAEKMILERLRYDATGARDLMSDLSKRLPKTAMTQSWAIIYTALYNLLKDGKIAAQDWRRTVGGQSGPYTLFQLGQDK